MPTIYPLRTQLNTGAWTEGDDCGPVTIVNAIKWASDNKIDIKQSEVAEWVRKIRRWAERPYGGFFLERDCLRVYRSSEFRQEFFKRGLIPPTPAYYRRGSWDTVYRKLKDGNFLHLPVDYGDLRSGYAPTGSFTFTGDHYVALLHAPRISRKKNYVVVWDGDPLFDGRRDNIPDGWQHTRLSYFKKAAGEWGRPEAGYGYAYFIALKRNLGEYNG
jgi:hypothetical protein